MPRCVLWSRMGKLDVSCGFWYKNLGGLKLCIVLSGLKGVNLPSLWHLQHLIIDLTKNGGGVIWYVGTVAGS